jgi:hypothetical protein
MSHVDRRKFLKVLAGAGAGAASLLGGPMLRALASTPETEYFIFILAAGGWDVTLWSDPRNETAGLVNPASTENTDIAVIPDPSLWVSTPLDATYDTFQLVLPPGKSPLVFGPGIGQLVNHYDRLCLVNGLSMNTVSHPDGKAFSATGRHLAGGHAAAASVDTMISNELGLDQLLPNVSILFPSSYVGSELDPRAAPLLVDTVGTIGKSLSRSSLYESPAERDLVTAALAAEATDLAAVANDPSSLQAMALNYGSLKKMLAPAVQPTFSAAALVTAQPSFFPATATSYKPKFQAAAATSAAFCVEAMRLDLVRSVSFTLQGYDTHNTNYFYHLQCQQEGFDVIANLIAALDKTPHPTLTGDTLSEHTHILVVSDFCRTPQINLARGRDHYPNNSALVISPKFKQNFVFGATDAAQLLPANLGTAAAPIFAGGPRPIGPPDLLRTFVSAFGIDPAKYIRDGQVVPQLLVGS